MAQLLSEVTNHSVTQLHETELIPDTADQAKIMALGGDPDITILLNGHNTRNDSEYHTAISAGQSVSQASGEVPFCCKWRLTLKTNNWSACRQ